VPQGQNFQRDFVPRPEQGPRVDQHDPEKFKHTATACSQIAANQSFQLSTEFLPPTTFTAIATFTATLLWYSSRPCIQVTSETALWSTEYDASRQATLHPGAGLPAGHLKAGTQLRVLWTADGKDYRAYLVVGPHGQRGWVLFGQKGLAIPLAQSVVQLNYPARGNAGRRFSWNRTHWPGLPEPGR